MYNKNRKIEKRRGRIIANERNREEKKNTHRWSFPMECQWLFENFTIAIEIKKSIEEKINGGAELALKRIRLQPILFRWVINCWQSGVSRRKTLDETFIRKKRIFTIDKNGIQGGFVRFIIGGSIDHVGTEIIGFHVDDRQTREDTIGAYIGLGNRRFDFVFIRIPNRSKNVDTDDARHLPAVIIFIPGDARCRIAVHVTFDVDIHEEVYRLTNHRIGTTDVRWN